MHRAHHYGFLIERWRKLAGSLGLRLQRFAMAGAFPLFCLRTRGLRQTGGIYFSAGIHGDEAGSTEALLAWAEANAARLPELPLFLLPCLNPWGLVNNSRADAMRNDLNRSFQRDDLPEIVALRQLAEPYRFDLAIAMHEDYDGQGIYIYEIERKPPAWGEALLAAARPVMPIEPRTRVERRGAVAGIIRRRIDHRRFRQIGYPEAVWLHLEHAERTFTVETPSEFAIERRVAAHVAVLNEAVRLWQGLGR